MKILDRYVAKTLLKYSLAVMVILVGIFAFFKFLEEVENIGRASYTLLDALLYIAMTLPAIAYLLFSLIILLGVILSLGNFATHSELIVMRSMGLSVVDITKSTLKTSLFFAFVMIMMGEFLAPIASDYAKKYRAVALGKAFISDNQPGFWIKDKQHFIHVDNNINGDFFKGVTLIKLNSDKRLEAVFYSDEAAFNGQTISLQQAEKYQINTHNKLSDISQKSLAKFDVKVSFDQELLQSLKKRPQALSTWQLVKHLNFLSNNHLAADAYEVELYARLIKPLTLIAMIILSIPFVFGSLRDASLGKKIFLGIVISLFFQLAANLGAQFSLLYNLNHFLTASVPTLMIFILSLILLRRVSAR
jgi:lipopolysaccharide export system permease protein